MRKVTRLAMPESLRQNATTWKQDLMDALSSPEQDRKLIKRCGMRYKQDDIYDALKQMYGGLCCYCEARVGIVVFDQIEHRRPKSSCPEHTFDWDNLHLVCQVCNTSKREKWNDDHPILDSVHDIISDHLNYELEGEIRWAVSPQGETTIEHADLNRQPLREARTVFAHLVLYIIDLLSRDPDFPAITAGRVREELQGKTTGEYRSLFSWLLDSLPLP